MSTLEYVLAALVLALTGLGPEPSVTAGGGPLVVASAEGSFSEAREPAAPADTGKKGKGKKEKDKDRSAKVENTEAVDVRSRPGEPPPAASPSPSPVPAAPAPAAGPDGHPGLSTSASITVPIDPVSTGEVAGGEGPPASPPAASAAASEPPRAALVPIPPPASVAPPSPHASEEGGGHKGSTAPAPEPRASASEPPPVVEASASEPPPVVEVAPLAPSPPVEPSAAEPPPVVEVKRSAPPPPVEPATSSPSPAPASPPAAAGLDARVAGSWETQFRSDQGTWVWTMRIAASGAYLWSSAGPIPLPPESGSFSARGGRFKRVSADGRVDEGTYELRPDGTLRLVTPSWTQYWKPAR